MTASLIINADDFGLHPAIDQGILRAHEAGVLTSATVLVMGSNARWAVSQAKSEGLALGLHFNLVSRLPPAASPDQVPSLLKQGRLRSNWREFLFDYARGTIRLLEVEVELRAQLQRAHDLGFTPDHIDSHQHLHCLPGLHSVVGRLSLEHSLPVRRPIAGPWFDPWFRFVKPKALEWLSQGLAPRSFAVVPMLGVAQGGRLDEEQWLKLLARLPSGLIEVGCHPGQAPDSIPEDPSWSYGWEQELAALTSPRLRQAIERYQVRLTTYREAFATHRPVAVSPA